MPTKTPIVIEALPVAAAIGAFGVIYGATAALVIGPAMTIVSSFALFSGAAQFTMVGLASTGATSVTILVAVIVLGLRHLPLSAILLPRLPESRWRRGLLGLALLDETTGLAVASPRPPAQTLAVVGATAYLAWIGGTVAGVPGADIISLAPLAEVVFVILFIGLSALTCRSISDALRAVAAAAATVVLIMVAPSVGALGAIAVAAALAASAKST